jgi:hypothetical protein
MITASKLVVLTSHLLHLGQLLLEKMELEGRPSLD